MSEGNLWATMQRNMKGRWQVPTRHEDAINRGIADVSFACGGMRFWMELKHIPMWPVRPTTVVRCDHFTLEQRHQLREQEKAAGLTFLFAQIDRDYMLFEGTWAADNFGNVVREELFTHVHACWHHNCDWGAFFACLNEAADVQIATLIGGTSES